MSDTKSPPMSEMVERACAAFWDCEADPQGSWATLSEGYKDVCRRRMRAAIAAMREPTQDMIHRKCADGSVWVIGNASNWRAMIDAALAAGGE